MSANISAKITRSEEDTLWHYRLGHPSGGAMQHIKALPHKIHPQVHDQCDICPLSKYHRLKFPEHSTKVTASFDLVHLDVWGPYKKPTYDMKHSFVTLVDDYSRYTWVCLIQSKSEVFHVLKFFLSLIQNQFGVSIKMFRSDNGKEFVNSQCDDLFKSKGIIHQTSCAYTP